MDECLLLMQVINICVIWIYVWRINNFVWKFSAKWPKLYRYDRVFKCLLHTSSLKWLLHTQKARKQAWFVHAETFKCRSKSTLKLFSSLERVQKHLLSDACQFYLYVAQNMGTSHIWLVSSILRYLTNTIKIRCLYISHSSIMQLLQLAVFLARCQRIWSNGQRME